jgi:hypothetical protein
MGVLDSFRKSRRPSGSDHTATVEMIDDSVVCRRSTGLTESVRWSDLSEVSIMTTSQGPALCDLFWVLVGQEKTGCVVPNDAQGIELLVPRLQKLPGFNNGALIQASSCTKDQKFLCWRRSSSAASA